MDATTKPLDVEADLDLDTELETWDWARTAGVSAAVLRAAATRRRFTNDCRARSSIPYNPTG